MASQVTKEVVPAGGALAGPSRVVALLVRVAQGLTGFAVVLGHAAPTTL
jgi:hypothetical protein